MAAKRFALGALVTWNTQDCVIVKVDESDDSYLIERMVDGFLCWVRSEKLSLRKKPNKYNARKVFDSTHGTFDSEAEYARWRELLLLQEAGEISELCRQVSFTVIEPQHDKRTKRVMYQVDFTYYEDGRLVAEEHKGYWTEAAKLKAYLFMEKYPHIKYVVTGTPL